MKKLTQYAHAYLPWQKYERALTPRETLRKQKARTTYEHLITAIDDPLIKGILRFLWEREVVRFQRFGDTNHTDLSRFCYELSDKYCQEAA